MKKSIAILLAVTLIVSTAFVACSKNKDDEFKQVETTTDPDGLEANADEYILDSVDVTDKDGKKVTDKDGKNVTTEIAYKIKKDKKGNEYKVPIDNDGNEVTNEDGKEVTEKVDKTTTKKNNNNNNNNNTTNHIPTTTTTKQNNVQTSRQENPETTNPNLTTIGPSQDNVPELSATGKACTFSQEDANIVRDMLEVPHLYNNSYENKDGVPTNIAAHAAMWMASKEGLNTSTFASGTIVLDLFKFFGQTVVNFKSKCNSDANKDYALTYSSNNDTFTMGSSDFEGKTHEVTGLKFYNLGNNNYYKVEANVSGCEYKKVTAIIQRNRLETTLGFSIKALSWTK